MNPAISKFTDDYTLAVIWRETHTTLIMGLLNINLPVKHVYEGNKTGYWSVDMEDGSKQYLYASGPTSNTIGYSQFMNSEEDIDEMLSTYQMQKDGAWHIYELDDMDKFGYTTKHLIEIREDIGNYTIVVDSELVDSFDVLYRMFPLHNLEWLNIGGMLLK